MKPKLALQRLTRLASAIVLVAPACAQPAPRTATPASPAPPPNQPPSATSRAEPAAPDRPGLPVAVSYEDLVGAPDRDEEDRVLDPQRKPVELLEFFDVKPGQRVAEIASGRGYTTELLARAVGTTGVVYGQNNRFVLERFAQGPWSERLSKPVMKPVKRLDTEFDAPFPQDVRDLDLVVIVLFYHDTVWQKTDRAKMNAAVFNALRPGGTYVVVDHSAQAGAGVSVAKTLHRIEESVVRREVESAGFELTATANFLRNAEDPRDWNASPGAAGERRGQSDRFALKFTKPQAP